MKLLSLPTKQFRTHHLFSKIRWRRKLLLVRGRLVMAVVVMLIMYFGTGSTKARTKYPWLGDEHVIVVREFNTARPDLNLEPRNCTNESNQTIPCETPQQGIPQNAGEDNAGENPPLPVEKIQEEHTRPPLIYEKYAKPTPAAPLSWIKKVPMEDTMRHDITIVTGYVNIGNFKNDLDKSTHTPGLYRKWLRHFEMIETPVVAYFTDDEDVNIFKKIRQGKSTYIVKVSKEGLWAFSLLDDIAKIYRQYSYPKHNPYTTVPEYTSAMHAKYEFMAKALKENPFKTNFFCWMDVGLFRNVTEPFQPAQTLDLKLPALFDEKRVAYSQINERKDLTVEQIFHNNMVWVCGCIFMAKGTIMKKWIYEYMRYIDKFLMEGIINTDQQVLYGMYMSREERLVDIQVYPWHGQYHQWFENGYMCEDKPGHWVKCLTLN